MEKLVAQHMPQIKSLLVAHGVERAYLFGSAAKGTMTDDSDIDFIIKFPDDMDFIAYSDHYFALAHELESLLHRSVDLVTEKTLQNPYLIREIDGHKLRLM